MNFSWLHASILCMKIPQLLLPILSLFREVIICEARLEFEHFHVPNQFGFVMFFGIFISCSTTCAMYGHSSVPNVFSNSA